MQLKIRHKKTDHASGLGNTLHKIGRDAYVDWALGFSVSFILMVVMVMVAYFSYEDNVENRQGAAAAKAKSIESIFNEKTLQKVLGAYEKKAEEKKQLTGSYTGPADPSL